MNSGSSKTRNEIYYMTSSVIHGIRADQVLPVGD